MIRPSTTESPLTVLHRPPIQRKLAGERADHGKAERYDLGVTNDLGGDSRDPVDDLSDTETFGRSELSTDELSTEEPGSEEPGSQELGTDELSDDLSPELTGGLDDVLGPEETAPRIDPRLVTLAGMSSADPRHGSLRRTVIEAHLPLVHHLAQRFRGRGEPYDDLVQVGTIGLLHAVDRYDPGRGSFAAFAVPTIVGEIRRHFRDRGWALRIPRRVQDLGRRVSEARETLTHNLDRSPTVAEMAVYLQVDADLVLEALETASAYITVPLPITADESDRMTKAFEDSGLELVEQRETLRPLLARLPARQQRILLLRFARGMSQSQIATEIGVSQMHVSRLLAKSLAALRSELTEEL